MLISPFTAFFPKRRTQLLVQSSNSSYLVFSGFFFSERNDAATGNEYDAYTTQYKTKTKKLILLQCVILCVHFVVEAGTQSKMHTRHGKLYIYFKKTTTKWKRKQAVEVWKVEWNGIPGAYRKKTKQAKEDSPEKWTKQCTVKSEKLYSAICSIVNKCRKVRKYWVCVRLCTL